MHNASMIYGYARVSTTGSASERRPAPGARHVPGDHQKVGRIAREAVNCRDDHHMTVGEGRRQFPKLRSVGGCTGDFLSVHPFATGRFELGKLAGEVLGVDLYDLGFCR